MVAKVASLNARYTHTLALNQAMSVARRKNVRLAANGGSTIGAAVPTTSSTADMPSSACSPCGELTTKRPGRATKSSAPVSPAVSASVLPGAYWSISRPNMLRWLLRAATCRRTRAFGAATRRGSAPKLRPLMANLRFCHTTGAPADGSTVAYLA